MPVIPAISYFLSRSDQAVTPGSELWHRQLPLSRDTGQTTRCHGTDLSISYAEYFEAVRDVITENRFEVIREAVGQATDSKINPEQIDDVRIFLEKHGEFYHPARICILIDRRTLTFVVNVAVSQRGLEAIAAEYRRLKRLRQRFSAHFIPAVYGMKRVRLPGGRDLGMFIGEWFRGYHEFHQSADSSGGEKKLVAWDAEQGNFFLTPAQCREAYRQAAAILTYYYNLETLEQIFSWHHAAGDFILRPVGKDALRMRLITVRRYTSLFENVAITPETMLEGLVVFFLNLSIRNRVDRLDGVGELAWSGPLAVPATVKGFFDGLEMKMRDDAVPGNVIALLKTHLASYSEAELYDLAVAMTARYPAKSPELPLIRHHLTAHVSALHCDISRLVKAS